MNASCCLLNFDRFIKKPSSLRLKSLTENFLAQNGPVSGEKVKVLREGLIRTYPLA
jgi:hypothetical protein